MRGAQTSHAPQGSRERLAEVLGNLRMAAGVRLGEGDDPVRPRLGDERCAVEERLHTLCCVVRGGRELDAHRPTLVETASHEARLLEHAHEDTRIPLRSDGCERLRFDRRRGSELAIHGPELGDGRDVRHREAPECDRIARAREQERLTGLAVSTGPADHLHVALERVGVVHEADETHVGLVDPHAERRGCHDRLSAICDEVVLNARPLGRLEPGVVVVRAKAVPSEDAGDLLGRAARPRVDDRGAALELA